MDDELLQITRLRGSPLDVPSTVPRSLRGVPPTLSEDFTEHVITGVRFATLLNLPVMPTVIRSRVWDPTAHKYYPESFRNACKEILLCSRAPLFQLVGPSPWESHINVASQLPKSIWMEILSFAHRDWFSQPESEAVILRRRLEQEQLAVRRAEEARRDAEMRLRLVERERDSYRREALRSRARLLALLQERGMESSEDMLTDDDFSGVLPRTQLLLGLSGMSEFVRRFRRDMSDDDEDEESDDDEVNHGVIAMETLEVDNESNSTSDHGIEENSVVASVPHMSSSDNAMAISRPPRTVSVSSDDVRILR